MVEFIGGFMIGGTVGVLMMALFTLKKQAEDAER